MSKSDECSLEIAEAMQLADWHRSAAIRYRNADDRKAALHEQIAVDADSQIAAFLAVAEVPVLGAGKEVVAVSAAKPTACMRETLANPTALNLEASAHRVALARNGGVFEIAVDAADSIGAENSLEKMLAHQMALCHDKAFELMAAGGNIKDPVEKVRLVNASARLMMTYQSAMLTLHRIRSGGRQVVTVQHVQVTDGGQAIVAGNVLAGGMRKPEGSEGKT